MYLCSRSLSILFLNHKNSIMKDMTDQEVSILIDNNFVGVHHQEAKALYEGLADEDNKLTEWIKLLNKNNLNQFIHQSVHSLVEGSEILFQGINVRLRTVTLMTNGELLANRLLIETLPDNFITIEVLKNNPHRVFKTK